MCVAVLMFVIAVAAMRVVMFRAVSVAVLVLVIVSAVAAMRVVVAMLMVVIVIVMIGFGRCAPACIQTTAARIATTTRSRMPPASTHG